MKKLFIFFVLFLNSMSGAMEQVISECYCQTEYGKSVHSPVQVKREKTYEQVCEELIKIKSEIAGNLIYNMVCNEELPCDDLFKISHCISEGADVNYCDEEKITTLMKAAFNGHDIVVEKLLLQNITPLWIDQQDMYGRTALMYAAGKGHKAIVNLLLAFGANKDLQDRSGWTAYQFAQKRGFDFAQKLKVDQEWDDRAELKEIVIEK